MQKPYAVSFRTRLYIYIEHQCSTAVDLLPARVYSLLRTAFLYAVTSSENPRLVNALRAALSKIEFARMGALCSLNFSPSLSSPSAASNDDRRIRNDVTSSPLLPPLLLLMVVPCQSPASLLPIALSVSSPPPRVESLRVTGKGSVARGL